MNLTVKEKILIVQKNEKKNLILHWFLQFLSIFSEFWYFSRFSTWRVSFHATVFIGFYEKNRKKNILKIGLYRAEPEPDWAVPLRAESRRAGLNRPNADLRSKLTNFHAQKSGNQSGFGDRSRGL